MSTALSPTVWQTRGAARMVDKREPRVARGVGRTGAALELDGLVEVEVESAQGSSERREDG